MSEEWAKKAAALAEALTSKRIKKLAMELGVRSPALRHLGVGWSRKLACYTFPQRDGQGRVVGIATRYNSGRKGFIAGGHVGLIIPDNLADLPDPVLVVEGPSDVAACLNMRLAAVGRPNNYGSKYLADVLAKREFILLGDYDPKPDGSWPGVEGVTSVARHLADELDKPIRWALPPAGRKDIRAWLLTQEIDLADKKARRSAGRELLERLDDRLNEIEPSPGRRFQILTGKEIMSLPEPEYQIEGLWPENSLVVLYGPPGTAKSFIALAWALAVLNGSSWMRQECQQGQAVYIATEGQGSLGVRLRAWEMGHRRHSAESLAILTEAPRLLNVDDRDALFVALKRLPDAPTLVVIDTMARTLVGGDENSARDVSEFIAAVDRIRTELGCTVLVVHHTGKDKGAERGSSALRGAADVMIKTDKPDPQRPGFKVTCEKMKDGLEFAPIFVELKSVETREGKTSCFLVSAELGPKSAEPYLPQNTQRLLEILRTGSKGSAQAGLTSNAWREQSGLSESAFKRALKPLKDKRFVLWNREGRRLRYWAAEANRVQGSKRVQKGAGRSGHNRKR